MKYNSLREVFEAFKNLKVLIIGDAMIDTYFYGDVERISPEAPVPILNVTKKESRLGGAANVALNIQSLGAEAFLCTVLGQDAEAKVFINLLDEASLSEEAICTSKHRTTTVKSRFISGSQQLLRVDEEEPQELVADDKNALIANIEKFIPEVDLIIFEDYDKGCIDSEIIRHTISLAHNNDVKVAVDPKYKNFLVYDGCDLFKPNFKELRNSLKLFGIGKTMDDLSTAVGLMREQMELNDILVTLSDKGIYFEGRSNKGHYQAEIRSISDVSGAGDTVISVAALCLALDLPIYLYAELANLAGGIVCEQQGVVPIDAQLLYSEAEKSGILQVFD
jgi:rfaE bifunctional protein kinase chain/domain